MRLAKPTVVRAWILALALLATATAHAGRVATPARPSVEFKLIAGGSARGPVSRWTAKRIASVKRKGAQVKEDWQDPAKRKKLIGNLAFQAASIGAGMLIDAALVPLGMPPLATAFLSGFAQTVISHHAQRELHLVAGKWVDAPPDKTNGQLLGEAAVAGIIGMGGQFIVGKVASTLAGKVRADEVVSGADRLLARGGIRLAPLLVKRAPKALNWLRDQATDHAYQRLVEPGKQRLFETFNWREKPASAAGLVSGEEHP
jgi:hypothetical protein